MLRKLKTTAEHVRRSIPVQDAVDMHAKWQRVAAYSFDGNSSKGESMQRVLFDCTTTKALSTPPASHLASTIIKHIPSSCLRFHPRCKMRTVEST